jgi:cell division transport system permease protein
MTFRRALGYFLREAASDLWKRRTVNLVSIATIGASLYVVALFALLLVNVGRAVSSWAEESRLSLYLQDTIPESGRAALEKRLGSDPAVQTFEYVSREQALTRFRKDFPELADLASSLDANPLPASYEITLAPAAAAPGSVEGIAASFGKEAGVDGVRYDLVWVERIRSMLRVIGWGGAILGGILLLAAIITISGVIRLNVLARREEIEILRLVGATRGFIRGPFVAEGAFQGIAASLVALAMIAGTWIAVSQSSFVHGDVLLQAVSGRFLPIWAPPALIAAGLAIGLAGSLFSVRRALASSGD